MIVGVLGANGQLGSDLVAVGRDEGLRMLGYSRPGVDVTRPNTLAAALGRDRPDVVINTSAWTHVDECESNPDSAYEVNAAGASNAARAARSIGARTVYISTDYVFDGGKPPPVDGHPTKETAYSEDDEPRPINVYGSTKLAGERATVAADPGALVVRCSGLYGLAGARGKGGNFIEAILSKAETGQEIRVVDDQHVTPTYTRDAAAAILEIVRRREQGLLHVAGPGACTWFTFARSALMLAGSSAIPRAIPSAQYVQAARRPANSALLAERASGLMGGMLPHWQDGLSAYFKDRLRMNRNA